MFVAIVTENGNFHVDRFDTRDDAEKFFYETMKDLKDDEEIDISYLKHFGHTEQFTILALADPTLDFFIKEF